MVKENSRTFPRLSRITFIKTKDLEKTNKDEKSKQNNNLMSQKALREEKT